MNHVSHSFAAPLLPPIRRGLAWGILLLVALSLSVCRARQVDTPPLYEITGITMGKIEYKVLVPRSDPGQVQTLAEGITALLTQINQRMSTYVPESEVSRFNRHREDDWFAVSLDTAIVVMRGLEVSTASDGAFDITVKPLVDRWSFGATEREFSVPDESEIKALLDQIGYRNLEVRTDPPALRKHKPDLQIDLSAIAKGYAVDAVADYLSSRGLSDFFIEIGGEIRVRGTRADRLAWRIGIELPAPDRREVYKIIELTEGSLASSGNYRNFWEFQGRRFAHTIDPRTGQPILHEVLSATVIAGDCMTADALATAVLVVGRERGAELCRQFNAEVLTMSMGPGGQVREWASDQFPQRLDVQLTFEQQSSWRGMIIGGVIVFVLAFAAMAVGTMMGRKPIQGSCGGIGSGGDAGCTLCGGQPEHCDRTSQMKATTEDPEP